MVGGSANAIDELIKWRSQFQAVRFDWISRSAHKESIMNGIKQNPTTAVVDAESRVSQAAVGHADYSRTPNQYVTVEGTTLAYRTSETDPMSLR